VALHAGHGISVGNVDLSHSTRMTSGLLVLCLALAASPAAAVAPRHLQPKLSHENVEAMPMFTYKQDCTSKHRASLLAQQQAKGEIPGAGIDKFTPYASVYKDGFYQVECVKDLLLESGDKFGDGKYRYTLGDISNVSIVHYADTVPKEDQEPMSPEVCFKFCRTVPDMGYFGIHNGRDCYCTLYYKAMESDSTDCDAVCEGSPTQICGGKVKSSIFGMHECADTAETVSEAKSKLEGMKGSLHDVIASLNASSTDLQHTGEGIQGLAGQIFGDPWMANVMQGVKVYAGVLEHAAEDGVKAAMALNDAVAGLEQVKDDDFSSFDGVKAADDAVEVAEKTIAMVEEKTEELELLLGQANPTYGDEAEKAKEQYVPIMYFVDKALLNSVCTGDGKMIGNPYIVQNENGCAHHCNSKIHECVGYMMTPVAHMPDSKLCFLFEKFESVQTYSGCIGRDLTGGNFLQARAAKQDPEPIVITKVKFSKFDGATLKPDPSGKCDICLKKWTDRTQCPV